MARPTKYTKKTREKIVEAIHLGATYELAAHYAGISYELLRQWMKDPTKVAFLEAVKQAEGRAAVLWLAKIEKSATEGNWQAAAWKLERRFPHMYGRTIQEHTGRVETSIVPSGALGKLADELLDAVKDFPDARAALASRILEGLPEEGEADDTDGGDEEG